MNIYPTSNVWVYAGDDAFDGPDTEHYKATVETGTVDAIKYVTDSDWPYAYLVRETHEEERIVTIRREDWLWKHVKGDKRDAN